MAFIIIGAGAGLGEALAERFARAGHGLVLVARDGARLETLARELTQTHGIAAEAIAADVTDGPGYLRTVSEVAERLGGIEGVLFPIGLALRDDLSTPAEERARIWQVNFTSVVEATVGLWPELSTRPATIVGFGSITAIRGRARNMAYGAAKRALQAWFESLRLSARGTSVTVQFYVLGFLDTESMAEEQTALPKGNPARLAGIVHRNLGRDCGRGYFPGWWAPLAWLLRVLPQALYRRLAG